MNLIRELDRYDPKWRENISPDPLEAGVEVGLIEPEDLDEYQPLDFGD